MSEVVEVTPNVYAIDDALYSIPGAGSVYLLAEDKKALVDTGPSTSAKVVLEGVREAGFAPDEIDFIIITHIHLDHSGGAGTLLKDLPNTRVLAHYRAIKHLVDPSRLISSAYEAQGPEIMQKNGEMLPVEPERLSAIREGDTLRLSPAQTLTFMDTPGHAPHELCVSESRNGGIFVGDAVGHYVDGTDVMIPVTPPPSFDLELYIRTLNRLMSLKASGIYFSHSGYSSQAQTRLESAVSRLQDRENIIEKAALENRLDDAFNRVVSHISDGLEALKSLNRPLYDFWMKTDIPMSVSEHLRYYQKKHGL